MVARWATGTPRHPVSPLLCGPFEPFLYQGSKGAWRRGRYIVRKGNTMSLYEHIFIARQDISAQQVESLVEQFSNVITEAGGSIVKKEYWGLRNLAYKVKKNRKGHYELMNIDAPHAAVAEMERQMSLNDDILRFMTIRVDEHEEGPSAVMLNKGSRDRDGRGRGPRPPRGDGDRPRGDSDRPAPSGDRPAQSSEGNS